MCHVAAEMERQGFDLPLLIGGATTSRVHTAVKIHPNYQRGQAVYVNDASRAVGVAATLLSPEGRRTYVEETRREYAKIAAAHARGQQDKQRLSLDRARQNALKLDWAGYAPPRPAFLGAKVLDDYPLGELVDYIDWSPFFATWELNGRFPAILDDPRLGEAARAPLCRRARHARQDRRRELVPRLGGGGLLAGAIPRRRHRGLRRRGTRHAHRNAAHAAPAAHAPRRPRQSGARRFRGAARQRRPPIMSAPSWSPPASARTTWRNASRAPTTITRRSS